MNLPTTIKKWTQIWEGTGVYPNQNISGIEYQEPGRNGIVSVHARDNVTGKTFELYFDGLMIMNGLGSEEEVIKSIELFIDGLDSGIINLVIKKGDLVK